MYSCVSLWLLCLFVVNFQLLPEVVNVLSTILCVVVVVFLNIQFSLCFIFVTIDVFLIILCRLLFLYILFVILQIFTLSFSLFVVQFFF